MKDLITTIAKALVDKPEDVVVTEIEGEQTSVIELKVAKEKITKLEMMQKRLVRVESLLTNLALDTSASKSEKVSLNIK